MQIAIDDYGIGSSSLTDLKRLPVDTLKIHESFVADDRGHPADASIVGSVVELGHALGLNVAAEGVETDAQLAELRTHSAAMARRGSCSVGPSPARTFTPSWRPPGRRALGPQRKPGAPHGPDQLRAPPACAAGA